MPIQSVFTHQASAEAPVARSRAGQTEPRENGEVFALPDTEAAAGETKAGAAGKAIASGEAAISKEAAAAALVVDPAKVNAQVNTSQPVAEPPVARAPATKSEPQPAKAEASGIAFLIAMAEAQTGVQGEAGGEKPAAQSGEAAVETGEGIAKKADKDAAEGEGEPAVVTAVPASENQAGAVPVPVVVPPPLALPQGAQPATEAAAGEAVDELSADGGSKKGAAKPALAAATAGLPLVAAATPEAAQAAAAGTVDGKAALGGAHAVGAAGQGAAEFADTLAKADQPPAANGAQSAAEPKALDALQQQPAAPFDLSTLLQQAPGKSGHERLVQPFDPNAAAGNAPGAPGQGTASGQPTPIHVVPIEIGLRAMSGARQFDIRLDPDELGRVDVNLSISDKGEVSARLVVDRVETLHLLQRDARTLERAFEQAGLKPSDGGVDITLRDPSDQSAFRQNRQQDEAPQRPRQPDGIELAEDAPLTIDPVPQRRLIRLGGVDLSI
ncbi:flagellar hook-length control protein FliK [Bosea sp. ANAM02]|uniref:flagellar hook-length control protein FliK n=1 Tax=Bosea sp. ANAM02 TaxID=2020412 RepID=UPI00140F1CD2|nr:flagellar hook-length control protein FliK [Bosea sp. ANAM02]BCB18699.1 hypothetical protein OCUBac02_15930 [Bosea sp. ANAM02]